MNKCGLSERQQDLIARLKGAGFGWSKFARNVESQGWCSRKQENTMVRMLQEVERIERLSDYRYRRNRYDRDPDISEEEAIRSGVFF